MTNLNVQILFAFWMLMRKNKFFFSRCEAKRSENLFDNQLMKKILKSQKNCESFLDLLEQFVLIKCKKFETKHYCENSEVVLHLSRKF